MTFDFLMTSKPLCWCLQTFKSLVGERVLFSYQHFLSVGIWEKNPEILTSAAAVIVGDQ